MKRFVLSDAALQDMDGIIDYIRSLPRAPGIALGKQLRKTLESIAARPGLGAIDEEVSGIYSLPIHRRVCRDYLFFYIVEDQQVEVVAVLHGRRDVMEILTARVS